MQLKQTKAEKKYNELLPRYIIAFERNNGAKPFKIFFENGFVYLRSKEQYTTSKYRVSQFETMTATLEKRFLSTLKEYLHKTKEEDAELINNSINEKPHYTDSQVAFGLALMASKL